MKLGINPITTNKMRLITNKIIQVDPKFKGVIENSHLCDIGMHRVKNSHFKTLVQSIISQQLATKAALKINERVCDLVNNKFKPEVILSLTPNELRSAGISNAKVKAITELSIASLENRVSFDKYEKMPNHLITEELTKIWGIGRWTSEMFLIFHLGRLDVWPVGDLGVRRGWEKIHKLRNEIDPIKLDKKGIEFEGFQSVVAWYCWRAVDN
jgi:DNA-3-methyladenine glycosylase II